jgi:hypothetical protein
LLSGWGGLNVRLATGFVPRFSIFVWKKGTSIWGVKVSPGCGKGSGVNWNGCSALALSGAGDFTVIVSGSTGHPAGKIVGRGPVSEPS